VGQAIYRNSGMLFQYLYEHDLNTYLHLNRFIKSGSIQQFDSVIATMSTGDYNQAYQEFLNYQVSIKSQFTTLVTDYHDNEEWHCSSHQQIEKFALPYINQATCSVTFSSSADERFVALFSCNPLNAALTVKERFDYVNNLFDDQLMQLEDAVPNNLGYCTAYPKGNFLNSADGNFQFVVEGPLRNANAFPDALELNISGGVNSFQNVVTGDTVQSNIQFEVAGNSIFQFDSIAAFLPFATAQEDKVILPGLNFPLTVKFMPTIEGAFSGALNFFNNGLFIKEVSINGHAIQREISAIFPSSLSLEDVVVGHDIVGSIPFTVTGNKPFKVQSLDGPEGMTFEFSSVPHSPGSSGNIEYSITSDNVSLLSDFIHIHSNATAGVITIPLEANFVVGVTENADESWMYPNPATGQVFFNPLASEFRIEIKDSAGRNISTLHDVTEIYVGDYTPGLYFITIISAQGIKTQSLIKK
jgi:hypothetical protein